MKKISLNQGIPLLASNTHSPEGGLTLTHLPLGHLTDNELSLSPRDGQGRQTHVFRKQSVKKCINALLEDLKIGTDCRDDDKGTEVILPRAYHLSKNQLPNSTGFEEAQPGRKDGILVCRAIRIRH